MTQWACRNPASLLASELVGCKVRFRHLPEGMEPTSILVIGAELNMVRLHGLAGLFAPHLFVVVEPRQVSSAACEAARGQGPQVFRTE
jgi:hypothetical protein